MPHNRNRKLEISTKAKSREEAYSQALFQNKIDRQRVRSRESDRLWWIVLELRRGWSQEAGRRLRRGH